MKRTNSQGFFPILPITVFFSYTIYIKKNKREKNWNWKELKNKFPNVFAVTNTTVYVLWILYIFFPYFSISLTILWWFSVHDDMTLGYNWYSVPLHNTLKKVCPKYTHISGYKNSFSLEASILLNSIIISTFFFFFGFLSIFSILGTEKHFV